MLFQRVEKVEVIRPSGVITKEIEELDGLGMLFGILPRLKELEHAQRAERAHFVGADFLRDE